MQKNGGSKEYYVLVKKASKQSGCSKEKKYIESDTHMYSIAKQMRQESKDVVAKKYIWDDKSSSI